MVLGTCGVWLVATMPVTVSGAGEARAPSGSADAAKADAEDRPVAKVNGEPIMASELRETMDAQERVIRFQFAGDVPRMKTELANLKRTALDTLIDCQVLIDEFYKEDGVIEPEFVEADMNQIIQEAFNGNRDNFVAELARGGMTVDKFREVRVKMILIGLMQVRLAGEIKLTDEAVRAHYEKNNQRWVRPEQVKFHTVTIRKTTADARGQAESLRTKLSKGGDFAEIARANSTDSRAAEGGEWPWMRTADLDGIVRAAVKKTKKGELSEVLEQQEDFVVLRVDDSKAAEQMSFESVKKEVENSLRLEVGREHFEQRMIQLRKKADIQKHAPG